MSVERGGAQAAFPAAMPDGLPDCLYETDASGLPRAMGLLPDTSRAYRRRLAKEMRRWMRDLSDEYRESLDDNRVVMWFLESRLLCATAFWAGAEKPRRAGETPMPPSLERELLERAASQHAELLEPFTEAGMEGQCRVWRTLRGHIELAVGEPFHMLSPRCKALLMLWPIVRDALLDRALSLESDQARELIEAVFALSSITYDSWFVNEMLAGRPELARSFTRFTEQLPPAAEPSDDAIDEVDDEEGEDDDSDEAEEAFLPYLPAGLADSLYETDEHGVPRALRLLPDSSRAQRRRLAKELRRFVKRGVTPPAGFMENDVTTIMRVIEERTVAASVFWAGAAGGLGPGDRFLIPSLELALLQRERARHRAVVKPFDEAVFAAECREWRSVARDLEGAVGRSWRTLPRAGLDLLMVWPALRDELADPGLQLPSERARDALEGVFALSSVTMSPFFINAVCELRLDLCDDFLELEDRFLMEQGEDDEEALYEAEAEEAEEGAEGEGLDLGAAEEPIEPRPALDSVAFEAPEPTPAEAPGRALAPPEVTAAAAREARLESAAPATSAAETVVPEAALREASPQAVPAAPTVETARPAARPTAVAKGPEVTPIVQVVCELVGADTATAIQSAREQVLAWLADKGVGNLPATAGDGAAFEIDASEGVPVTVEAFDNVWALRADMPDERVVGRLWRTEVILGSLDGRALAGVRLTTISPRAGVPLARSVPRVVRRLVARPGLRDYGTRLMEAPWRVETEAEVDALVGLLERPARTRRVHVVSEDRHGQRLLDVDLVARRLAGLAHVVSLSAAASQLLRARVGDGLDVFGRAMRTYAPGFVCRSAPAADHPLALERWLEEHFASPREFIEWLERRATEESVRGDLEATLPSFARVRSWANARRLDAARRERATDADLLGLYTESNETLAAELRDREATIERLRLEQLQIEEERDEALRDIRQLRGRIDFLEQALQVRGIEEGFEYPSNYDEVEQWVARYFADRLTLLPRAVRSLKKAVFENLPLVCDCLALLAGQYRDMKLGKFSRAAFDESCVRLGVTLTQSGDFSASRYANEYTVTYGKTRRVLDLHLKRGTSRDAAKCLRLYFFWDPAGERVVVGHLPGHLTTSFT
jgi:hypothetical protein